MPSYFPEHLSPDRMTETSDVSAAFDNCFFHSLALYWLASERPLPEEWFAHQAYDEVALTQLKNVIKNEKNLDIFSQYERIVKPSTRVSSCLVEKVFVLGLFLRSYFISELVKDITNKNDLFSGHEVVDFSTVLNFFLAGTTDLDDPLYQANDHFFQGNCDIKPTSSLEDIQRFWMDEGYDNYCRYLASPGVKIAYYEVKPVLEKINIPYCFYDNEGQVLASSSSSGNEPHFEVILNPLEGHYKLLKNPTINPQILTGYTQELARYHCQRTLLLEQPGLDKIGQSVYYSSLLLASTLPKECLNNQSPLAVLVDKVTFINDVVTQPKETEYFTLNKLPFPKPLSNQWDEGMYKALRLSVMLETTAGQVLNEFESIFHQHLEKLKEKVTSFYQVSQTRKEHPLTGKYHQAGQEVLWLYIKLSHAFDEYLVSNKEEDAFWTFQRSCHEAIRHEKYFGTLEQHRGAKQILGNIGLAIAGVGIIYAIATCVNWYVNGNFLFFNNTDTGDTMQSIESSFAALAPSIKVS